MIITDKKTLRGMLMQIIYRHFNKKTVGSALDIEEFGKDLDSLLFLLDHKYNDR